MLHYILWSTTKIVFLQTIESKLKVTLPDNLPETLKDGVLLCQLANNIRPRSVTSIHVPSPAVVCIDKYILWLICCAKMDFTEAWYEMIYQRSYEKKV